MNLIELITGSTGQAVAQEVENKHGVSKGQILSLLGTAAPMIVSQLSQKSQSTEEAEALNQTLSKNHDGSILSNPAQVLEREEEGQSILSHIFGDNKGQIEEQLAEKTGISSEKIGPVLASLAPVVMGFIGKQKNENESETGGGISDFLTNLLPQDGNGSSVGDMLTGVLGKVTSGESGIGEMIGEVLGGDNADPKKESPIKRIFSSLFGK